MKYFFCRSCNLFKRRGCLKKYLVTRNRKMNPEKSVSDEKEIRLVKLINHQHQIIEKIQDIGRLIAKLSIARKELKDLVYVNISKVETTLKEIQVEGHEKDLSQFVQPSVSFYWSLYQFNRWHHIDGIFN